MTNPLGPGHVGHMNESIDPLIQLNERAEVGKVPDGPFDACPDRVAFLDQQPGVGFDLAKPQRDPLIDLIDIQDYHFYRIPNRDDLRGVFDPLCPGHLRNMNQPLDPIRKLNEGAIVGQAHHLAANAGAERKQLINLFPRILQALLMAERDSLSRPVKLEDQDLDLGADGKEFRGMTDTAPGHIGNMKQAVQSAEIDERAILSDILDLASYDFSFF